MYACTVSYGVLWLELVTLSRGISGMVGEQHRGKIFDVRYELYSTVSTSIFTQEHSRKPFSVTATEGRQWLGEIWGRK